MLLAIGCAGAFACLEARAQTIDARSESSFRLTKARDSSQTAEIQNVTYEYTGTGIPGRPQNEHLLLRKTVRSKAGVDDVGTESTVRVEAWPLGARLDQKPIYTISENGTGGRVVYPDLFVVDRGLEEVEWWTVHRLGTGRHLFDTYVPLVSFSISRDVLTMRYAGLEVPPDDVADARLKEPHIVAVLIYASGDRIVREALLTTDTPNQATELRSYADATRKLGAVEDRGVIRALKLSISQNYPSPPTTIDITIPVANDDLDLAHAQLPPRLHLAAWKR